MKKKPIEVRDKINRILLNGDNLVCQHEITDHGGKKTVARIFFLSRASRRLHGLDIEEKEFSLPLSGIASLNRVRAKKRRQKRKPDRERILSGAYCQTIEKQTGCLVLLKTGQGFRFYHRLLSEGEEGFVGFDTRGVFRRLCFKDIASIKPLKKRKRHGQS